MNKIKSVKGYEGNSPDVFFMSLEEAKQAIIEKYDFLQDRYERSKAAKKRSVS